MLIELKEIYKIYGEGLESEVRALDGISLTIDRESCGHRGTVRLWKVHHDECAGLPGYPHPGDYLLDGVNVRELSDKELSHIRNKQIGFIFQQYNWCRI